MWFDIINALFCQYLIILRDKSRIKLDNHTGVLPESTVEDLLFLLIRHTIAIILAEAAEG